MARDAINPVTLPVNAGTSGGAGVAINVTNGAVIPAGAMPRVLLKVTNTYAGAKKVTIKAGVYPPAWRKDLGDLEVSIAQNATHYFVLETARFAQADGAINVDYESAMTGTAWAFKLPADF
jgi:hypothetical protein